MMDGERLFEAFIDPVDGILCLPAKSDAATVELVVLPHGLRFPLALDRTTPLREQVAASGFAPASSRYGPYCDNITGMNWELPDGRLLRIGERVVKSTTGYDLLRFLLASGTRYGQAKDYVLRLRPACDTSIIFRLCGEIAFLRAGLGELLRTSWMHWFDSVDLIIAHDHPAFIRVVVHCPENEAMAYKKFLSEVAAKFSLDLECSPGFAHDGCPDLVLKTRPELVVNTALDLAKTTGTKCVALCACGVVHVFLGDQGPEAIHKLIGPIESHLHGSGGHWQSRHLERTAFENETIWVSRLRTEWGLS